MAIGRKALEAFVEDVVTLEFAPRDEVLAHATARWVGERAVGASALGRGGLLAPAVALNLAALARYASPYAGLARAQRLPIAERLAHTRTPPAVDWVRAVRLLAVTYVFERRCG